MKNIKDSNGNIHKTYESYLKSNHWRKIKKLAKERYGYKCSHCGSEEPGLHLHHKTYKRVGNEKLEDLKFLCEKCHSEEHKRLNSKKRKKSKKKKKPYKKTKFEKRLINNMYEKQKQDRISAFDKMTCKNP